jgi:5,5'-dehydrodivanillate O-demethylase oxygenase subunit
MLTAEQNDRLTQVGPGTPMGDYLRRYWHPVAGISEFDTRSTKPLRLFGEDLVLYRDLSGTFGLIGRQCPHRRADMAYAMVEKTGLRCNYHGWCFKEMGECVEQPFEDMVRGERAARSAVRTKAYPVETKAGMVWAYMGPDPAPLLPDWEAFTWENGFAQIVLSEVPCNWLQCQENSIDPVHFEWMHENWGQRLRGVDGPPSPRHMQLDFNEFDYGFSYHRIKEDTDASHENWTVGRVFLWPNAFYLTEHFEWRVPIDDENTLSVLWKWTRVPREQEPYVQANIPTWDGPTHDAQGNWITTHVMNQDFLAWAGQGRIADRTVETLGLSDKGVVMVRRRFSSELDAVARGEEPKGLVRDPALNKAIELPSMGKEALVSGHSLAELEANPALRLFATTFVFQAGQPDWVKKSFEQAMGLIATEFAGLDELRKTQLTDV